MTAIVIFQNKSNDSLVAHEMGGQRELKTLQWIKASNVIWTNCWPGRS